MKFRPDDLNGPPTPYGSPRELFQDVVIATRMRLTAVKTGRTDQLDPVAWPGDLLALEARISNRMAISDPSVVPLIRLRRNVGLTETEERILWLLLAHERCSITRKLVRELATEDIADPTSSVLWDVIYEALDGASEDEIAEDGTLRRFGLIERTDGGGPIGAERQTWRASDRVRALAFGNTKLDPSLRALTAENTAVAIDLEVSGDALKRVRGACTMHDGIVIVVGPSGYGRRSVLIDALTDRRVLLLDGRAFARDRDGAARQVRAVARECVLLDYVPVIRNIDALGGSMDTPDRLDLIESELRGLVAATSSTRIARAWKRPAEMVELHPLPTNRRAAIWRHAIGALNEHEALDYAGRYPITPALIHALGMQATKTTTHPSDEEIRAALLTIVETRLGKHAQRVAVTHKWSDLVLADDQGAAIGGLIARIKHRATVNARWGFAPDANAKGLGVVALFSGPPGTGKTMTAGLVAEELGVEIYQVDISKIVSKYIGETEKQLAEIFDAADGGHAVLLFDEADSLFGKRTDVRTSTDRYANMEVNFLLSRIESFTGIVILTTNHDAAIDPAFKRRISAHVRFPMPDLDERKRLWRVSIPKEAPTRGELGHDKLAEKFDAMSGANIRNAALRGAFLAAADNTPIEARHLLEGARAEYQDMDKLTSKM